MVNYIIDLDFAIIIVLFWEKEAPIRMVIENV